jgi:pimeloyl-ACP methyl ester carboxylesterase
MTADGAKKGDRMTKHGIVIIHGVGRHEPLQVLGGFATGLVDTMYDLLSRISVPTVSGREFVLLAHVDESHKDKYVEVSWMDGQHLFRIKEAYWQRAIEPHSLVRVWRWLWNTVTRLMSLDESRLGQLALLVVGGLLCTGQALTLLIALGFARRAVAVLLSPLAGLIAMFPERAKEVAQAVLNIQFAGVPVLNATFAALPDWAQLWVVLQVVIAAIAFVDVLRTVRSMWLERQAPWGWRQYVSWYVGGTFLALAGWVALAMGLNKTLQRLPGFPGRLAISRFLEAFGEWLQQDAVGDAEIFASDDKQAERMRRQLEEQIEYFHELQFDEIHVIGHSLGGIISFEVLSRTLPTPHKRRIKTYFTVGSPLKTFLDILLEDPVTRRLRDALPRLVDNRAAQRVLGRLGDNPTVRRRLGKIAGPGQATALSPPTKGSWDQLKRNLQESRDQRAECPNGPRFCNKIDKAEFAGGFSWRNIVADWDLAPDLLQGEDLGEVTDIPVTSTRKLGAHSGYWDTGCESLRYILEQIQPDVFGTHLHEIITIRKAMLQSGKR